MMIIFIQSCSLAENRGCSKDAKICPDGTLVGRVPPNCEFEACPVLEDTVSTFLECVAAGNAVMESYPRQCRHDNELFVEVIEKQNEQDDVKVFCKPGQREGDFCIQIDDPVCGWFGQNIQCIRYPCAQTFSNSCFACLNEDVAYHTKGSCSSG